MNIDERRLDSMIDNDLNSAHPETTYDFLMELLEKASYMSKEQRKLEYLEFAKREIISPFLLEQWGKAEEQEIQNKKDILRKEYEDNINLKEKLERLKGIKRNFIENEEKRALSAHEMNGLREWSKFIRKKQ